MKAINLNRDKLANRFDQMFFSPMMVCGKKELNTKSYITFTFRLDNKNSWVFDEYIHNSKYVISKLGTKYYRDFIHYYILPSFSLIKLNKAKKRGDDFIVSDYLHQFVPLRRHGRWVDPPDDVVNIKEIKL